jgi:hypothetical protein
LGGSGGETKPSIEPKAAPNVDSSDSESDASEGEKPKARQIKPIPHLSADSPAEESTSSSEDSDSDSGSDTSPKSPAATLKKIQSAKDVSSDTDSSASSASEESSDGGSDEDVEMDDRFPATVATGRLTTTPYNKLKPIPCFRQTKGRGLSCSPS